jgi:hypothetical protein
MLLQRCLTQLATDPVLPKLLNQAIEFAKALPPDEKAIDSKETARVCSALSSVINDIRAGTRVTLPDIQLLCQVIKLGGLSQQDSHEAFIKLTDSVRSVLKYAAEVQILEEFSQLMCRRPSQQKLMH